MAAAAGARHRETETAQQRHQNLLIHNKIDQLLFDLRMLQTILLTIQLLNRTAQFKVILWRILK